MRAIVDEAWYVECDLEDALAAVIARQVQALTGFRVPGFGVLVG